MAGPTDGGVVVAPDSTGKTIDAQVITPNGGTALYRQTVTLGDPLVIDSIAGISPSGELRVRTDRMQEYQLIQAVDSTSSAYLRRHAERASSTDRRGTFARGSTR